MPCRGIESSLQNAFFGSSGCILEDRKTAWDTTLAALRNVSHQDGKLGLDAACSLYQVKFSMWLSSLGVVPCDNIDGGPAPSPLQSGPRGLAPSTGHGIPYGELEQRQLGGEILLWKPHIVSRWGPWRD